MARVVGSSACDGRYDETPSLGKMAGCLTEVFGEVTTWTWNNIWTIAKWGGIVAAVSVVGVSAVSVAVCYFCCSGGSAPAVRRSMVAATTTARDVVTKVGTAANFPS